MPKLKYPNKSHKGKAGRKASPLPSFWKRFRATEEERAEFMRYMTGDSRLDFLLIFAAVKHRRKEDFPE